MAKYYFTEQSIYFHEPKARTMTNPESEIFSYITVPRPISGIF